MSPMRSHLRLLLLTSTLVLALTTAYALRYVGPVSAQPLVTLSVSEVIVVDLFLRAGPGETFLPVSSLVRGDTVLPIGRNAQATWIAVRHETAIGWVRSDLVRWAVSLQALPVVDASALTATPQATYIPPTATPEGSWVNVGDEGAYVRSGPGFTYEPVGIIRRGDTLEAVGRTAETDWILVRFGDGFGWILRTLVRWDVNLNALPILVRGNLTPSPTHTASSTPSATASATSTYTPTLTPSVTATPSLTSTPTETSTDTPTATFSPTASPTPTVTPSPTVTATLTPTATATPSLTSTPTEVSTDTPTATFSPTASWTPTVTPSPTVTTTLTPTTTATPSWTPTPTETSTDTPTATFNPSATPTPTAIVTATVIASTIPSPAPSPSQTAPPTLTASSPALVSATATDVSIAAVGTGAGPTSFSLTTPSQQPSTSPPASPTGRTTSTVATPSAPPQSTPVVQTSAVPPTLVATTINATAPASPVQGPPLEVYVGLAGLLGVISYGLLYWRGQAQAERFQNGFFLRRCPVCQQGNLVVQTRRERILGIPRGRHIVSCTHCRSLLREAGPGRWRYAVDKLDNPRLHAELNGKVIRDEELLALAQREQIAQPPVVRSAGRPPRFVDEDDQPS